MVVLSEAGETVFLLFPRFFGHFTFFEGKFFSRKKIVFDRGKECRGEG
jgi:hypothetical protein